VSGWFVWHELLTPNAAGAHEFYGKTLGWEQQPWEGDPAYVMFKASSGPVGATVESKTATPHWLPYISTRDVDATIEAAGRLGGRVEKGATPLPDGGRYAVLVDPQGAPFGIHAAAKPADAVPPAGEFSWHELATSVAPGIAFGFYGALFDWDEISEHDMGPMGMYLIFGRNGRRLGGMFDKGAAGKPGPAYWLGYARVTDVEGTVERAKAARGSLLMGPMDVPGGDRVAQLMDPYGAFFALHKAAGETAPAATAAQRTERKPAKKAAQRTSREKPAGRKAAGKKRSAKKPAAKRTKPAARKKAKKRAASKAPMRKAAKPRPTPKKKAKKKRGRR
jgi:predicted enzyme related to lactoylglutathione lyase